MRLLALAALLLALAACGTTPCEELGNRICSCEAPTTNIANFEAMYDPTGILNACSSATQAQLGANPPTDADEQRCQSYLSTCPGAGDPTFCARVQTPQGKVDCGMAYSPAP